MRGGKLSNQDVFITVFNSRLEKQQNEELSGHTEKSDPKFKKVSQNKSAANPNKVV